MTHGQEYNEWSKTATLNIKKKLDDALEVGQLYRNGGGRVFEILKLTEDQIELLPKNPDKNKAGRTLLMSRKVFIDLYHLKNYSKVIGKNASKEALDARATGADRFLI